MNQDVENLLDRPDVDTVMFSRERVRRGVCETTVSVHLLSGNRFEATARKTDAAMAAVLHDLDEYDSSRAAEQFMRDE